MKILVYDDNPGFGGHQFMACHGIEALAAETSVEVACMVNPANRKLIERLAGLTLHEPDSDFHALGIDLVLCIQGDIGQSTNGILAANKNGIPCVSYIAIPHRMADMRAKLGALRDRMNERFINAPDRFITISESMRQILIDRGCIKPIEIVPNGIPIPQPAQSNPQSPNPTIGLIGRIEFKQKQQDFMVQAFLDHSDVFNDCRLLIAGGGPDRTKLEKLIRGKENITLLPWTDDAETLYRQIDLLAIPSRYEGVPLVMLEALARAIPVIGSNRDGMKDLLPEEWTFEPGNANALADTFSNLRTKGSDQIGSLQRKVLDENSLDAFKINFVKTLAGH